MTLRIGPAQRAALALIAAGRAGRILAVEPGPRGRLRPTIPPAVARAAGGARPDRGVERGVQAKGLLDRDRRWWRITARGLDALDGLLRVILDRLNDHERRLAEAQRRLTPTEH